jgi:hypothetical protein
MGHERVSEAARRPGIDADTAARIDPPPTSAAASDAVQGELDAARDAKADRRRDRPRRTLCSPVKGSSSFDPRLLRDTLDVALERLGHGP